jgi:hypothetical protein
MAEYEIGADKRFESSLEYIKRRASGRDCVVRAGDGAIFIQSDRKIDGLLVDAIADVIITDCKAFYINERIRLPIGNPYLQNAFTSALSTFDRDTDKIIVKTILDGFFAKSDSGVCQIDGIYEFMLDVLKSRWDEVCSLANENIRYLVCQRTFMELLRFLISNIDSITDEAHIVRRGARFEVLGKGFSPIENIYINESLPNDIQVVNKLVAIAPKHIFLHDENAVLEREIENLFGNCTVVQN